MKIKNIIIYIIFFSISSLNLNSESTLEITSIETEKANIAQSDFQSKIIIESSNFKEQFVRFLTKHKKPLIKAGAAIIGFILIRSYIWTPFKTKLNKLNKSYNNFEKAIDNLNTSLEKSNELIKIYNEFVSILVEEINQNPEIINNDEAVNCLNETIKSNIRGIVRKFPKALEEANSDLGKFIDPSTSFGNELDKLKRNFKTLIEVINKGNIVEHSIEIAREVGDERTLTNAKETFRKAKPSVNYLGERGNGFTAFPTAMRLFGKDEKETEDAEKETQSFFSKIFSRKKKSKNLSDEHNLKNASLISNTTSTERLPSDNSETDNSSESGELVGDLADLASIEDATQPKDNSSNQLSQRKSTDRVDRVKAFGNGIKNLFTTHSPSKSNPN